MIRLKAEAPVYGGYVMARGEGVVFVKGALSGEVVDVEVAEKKRDYSIALVREVIEPSPFRVEPACPHFGHCGGCQLQHMAYAEQLSMKNIIVKDCFRRIAGVEVEPLSPLAAEDFHYRHRAQFKVAADGRIGFFREGTRDVVDIEACPVLSRGINRILGGLRRLPLHGIKEIHVTDGDSPGALIKGKGFDEKTAEDFITAGFETVAFADGSRRGRGYVLFDLCGLRYSVSPWSFLQSNWALNQKAAGVVAEALAPLSGRKILDVYAGGGNFSLPLCAEAEKIVAVEESAPSVKDGMRNIELNGVKNMKFVKAKVEGFFSFKGTFDAVIIDPPRPGLQGEAVSRMVALAPERILYISCNPSTLARDVKKLAPRYRIDSVRLVDFFPNTYHIEAFCLLSAA